MSVKGGKSWRHGAHAAPGKSHLASKGRKLVCNERLVGTLKEWHGAYGWIVPLQQVSHPRLRGNKIYVRSSDIQEGCEPSEGSKVDFFLYCDEKGIGAGDCREVHDEAAGPALPEGWEKVWSEEHGQFYYWNAKTKEAAWDLPGLPDTADDGEPPLPEGWEKHYDTENKEFYFWHRPTKTTTWERPTMDAAEGEPAPEASGENEEGDDDDEEARAAAQQKARDAPVLAQQRLSGHITHWQGSFGWIAPVGDLPEDLEPLVADQQNKVYLNWRALPAGLTPKVGLHIDFYCSADETGIVATDVTEHDGNAGRRPAQPTAPWRKRRRQPVDPMAQLEKQWAKQDFMLNAEESDQADETANPAITSGGTAEEATEGVLLPGWEQLWSDEHQCHYYWHAEAKMSSWDRPAVPIDDAPEEDQRVQEDDDPSQDKVWPGEGTVAGAARLATPITPVVGRGAGREMTPITPAAGIRKLPQQPLAPPPSAAFQAWAIGKSGPSKGCKGGSPPMPGRAGKGPSQWADAGAQTGSGALPSSRGTIGAAAWVRKGPPAAPAATTGARPGFDRLIPRWQFAAKRPRL